MPKQRRHILIDWGTSNARAWLVGPDGAIHDRYHVALGIKNVKNGDFDGALRALTADWPLEPGTPILMSGMIGARQGWLEAPYVPCPAALDDLAAGIVEIPDAPHIRIVPGVHDAAADRAHDVMRGEEVQIFGALSEMPNDGGSHLFCLPGTHSKWALVDDGRLVRFATALTGEAFSAFAEHTILGALMPDAEQAQDEASHWPAGFSRGLARSREAGGLLHHLFGVRAQALFDELAPAALPAYLSGILIGHEVAGMAALFEAHSQVIVVAEPTLARHYVDAITASGRAASLVDAEIASLAGLAKLAGLPASRHEHA